MLKVIVASENPVKIKCVRNVFSKYFKKVEVIGKKADSKVSHQPKTERETIKGARNRAEQIYQEYEPDFAVGIEGGIEKIERELYSFAWVCIKSQDGTEGLGRTASFLLPQRIEELINNGKELGEADDIVFGLKNSKQKMGAIGLLSKGKLDRAKLYEQGVISALLPFLNPKLYKKEKPKMKTIKYNKLVRDRIPEIIKKQGKVSKIHIAQDKEYWQGLKEKLGEEVEEFLKDSSEEELADILEVIYALADFKKIAKKDLEKLRKKKAEEKGSFKKRIILEEIK